jgi:outer membrane protein TolC
LDWIRLCPAAAVAALLGCQSYTERPLDLDAHREAWLARLPTDEGISAFAERLAAAEGGAGYDLADGLSLREGEAVALFYNPDLRLARLRAERAQASARYAGLWEDPELGVDAERVIESVPEPWVVGASIGITLPISGRLAVEEARAGAAHAAELRRLAAEEWETRAALRGAWLEWSAERVRAELAQELVARLRSIVGIVERLEQTGELSRTEARLFAIERVVRASELAAIEAAAREGELAIRALMGLSPSAAVELVPAALGAAEADMADAPAGLGESNPALAALRAEYEVAEQALRLEVREQYPDITIGPGGGVEEGDSRVTLGVSLPIPLWNRNRRAIAEATVERDIARAAFETEYERLAARLAEAESRLDAARAQRVALETELAPMVEEQDAEAIRVAELGEVDTLVLLESLTRLHETKTALIDARLAEALAGARVRALTGPGQDSAETHNEGVDR